MSSNAPCAPPTRHRSRLLSGAEAGQKRDKCVDMVRACAPGDTDIRNAGVPRHTVSPNNPYTLSSPAPSPHHLTCPALDPKGPPPDTATASVTEWRTQDRAHYSGEAPRVAVAHSSHRAIRYGELSPLSSDGGGFE